MQGADPQKKVVLLSVVLSMLFLLVLVSNYWISSALKKETPAIPERSSTTAVAGSSLEGPRTQRPPEVISGYDPLAPVRPLRIDTPPPSLRDIEKKKSSPAVYEPSSISPVLLQ